MARCGDAWTAVDAASFALAAAADARSLGSPAAAARVAADLGGLLAVVAPSPPVVAALFDRDQVLGCDAEPAAPPYKSGGGRERVLTLEGVVPGAPASLGASLARARLRGEGPGGRGLASFALGGSRVFAAPPGGATALLATEDLSLIHI